MADCFWSKNGVASVFNNQEVGFITKFIDQSLSFCYLEDLLKQILKQVWCLQDTLSLTRITRCLRTPISSERDSELSELANKCSKLGFNAIIAAPS